MRFSGRKRFRRDKLCFGPFVKCPRSFDDGERFFFRVLTEDWRLRG